MGEYPSHFDPEATTQKWNDVMQKGRSITNKDLFELSRDIVYLNWQDFMRYNGVNLDVPVGKYGLLVSICVSYDPAATVEAQREVVTLFVDQGKHHDRSLHLLYEQRRRGRYSTYLYDPDAYSMLADDIIKDDSFERVRLESKHKKAIAQKLWEAYLYTLQLKQQESA